MLSAQGAAEAASSIEVQSVWDFVVKGGLMMIPIALGSLIALTVIIERSAIASYASGSAGPGGSSACSMKKRSMPDGANITRICSN